jgi:hypothetical protein
MHSLAAWRTECCIPPAIAEKEEKGTEKTSKAIPVTAL